MFKYFLSLLLALPLLAEMANIETISSEFTQTIIEVGGKKIEYRGTLTAKAPYYGIWEYSKPIVKKVYVIEDRVIMIEPELEQVVFAGLKSSIDFMSLLKSAKKVAKNEYLAKYDDIEYKIYTKDDGVPHKLTFVDKLENNTEVLFKDTKINTPLEKELFLYSIPEGYDVIRE